MPKKSAALLLGYALCLASSGCRGLPVAKSTPPTELPHAPKSVPAPSTTAAPTATASHRAGARALPCGTSLIVESDPLAATVAVAAFFAVSAADESRAGERHFLERLLLDSEAASGTLAAKLRRRGIEVVSFTTPDYTAYQLVGPRGSLGYSLELLRKLFDEPPASESALSRQRRSISAELSAARGDGEALRSLFAAASPGHPYQKSLLGSVENLESLQAAPLRAFHRRYYRPERLTVVVVGDVEADPLTAQLQTRLGELDAQKDEVAPESPSKKLEPTPGPRLLVLSPSFESIGPELYLGFALPPAKSEELPALEVASLLLSDETRRSFVASGRELGLLVVSSPARSLEDTLRGTLAAALRLGQREVSAVELSRAQGQLSFGSALRSESPWGRAQRLYAFHSLGVDEAAYEASLLSLTPASLRDTLRRYLDARNLTLLVTASKKLADEAQLRRLLDETVAATQKSDNAAQKSAAISGKAQLYRLSSGARLVILRDANKKSVALSALWPGGQRLEDERSVGLHELYAHIWPEKINAAGTLEAQVELDSFGLRAQFLSRELSKGLALLRDNIEHPNISDVDIERGRRELLVRLGVREHGAAQKDAEASRAAWRLFLQNLLGSHPYALRPTEQSLTGLSRRRLLDFYRQHYPRHDLILSIVGDVEPAALLFELEPWLGTATAIDASRASQAALGSSTARPISKTGQAFVQVQSQQAHLVLGFAAPGSFGAERAAVEVLFELLAGDGGLLQRALLLRRGLAFSLEGQLSAGLLPGYLAFYLSTTPQKLESADATLRDELHRLVDNTLETDEVMAARERVISRYALAAEPRTARAWQLGKALAFGLPDRALDGEKNSTVQSFAARLAAVDVAAVRKAATSLLREEQMVRAAAIPATRQPVFGILPPAPRTTSTEYRTNAKNVVSRSAKPGDDRRDGARSQHLPDGRRSRPLSGRLQGLAGHAAKVRREAHR